MAIMLQLEFILGKAPSKSDMKIRSVPQQALSSVATQLARS